MKEEKKIVYVRQDDRQYLCKKEKARRIISKVFFKIKYEKIENGLIIIIPNYRRYRSVIKEIIIKKINNIVKDMSNYYFVIDEGLKFLEESHKTEKILSGKVLMKELSLEILEYVFDKNKQIMNLENIYIFVNEYSKNNIYLINKLVYYFRTVNIITENLINYRRLENDLYKQGILITVSNNKRKSAINAKYIINIDFENERLNNYRINHYAIIINHTKEKNILGKSFKGIIVNDIILNIDKNYKEYINEFYGKIENTIFIESVLISNELGNNRIEYLKKEYNLEVEKLVGIRGKISTQEIKEICKYYEGNKEKITKKNYEFLS